MLFLSLGYPTRGSIYKVNFRFAKIFYFLIKYPLVPIDKRVK